MSMEWSVANNNLFANQTMELSTAEEVFQIEKATTEYFFTLLADQGLAFQGPNHMLDTSVSVRDQSLSTGANSRQAILLESTITVIHIGDHGISDLSALLMFVTNKNTTSNSSFTTLDSMIGMGISVDMVAFTNAKESKLLTSIELSNNADATQDSKYTESEKTLIVVTSVLSFALFALSIILIWIAGGWLALRKQVKVLLHREEELSRMTRDIKQRPTQDTDEEAGSPTQSDVQDDVTQFTNPSGILGVNPYYGRSERRVNDFAGMGIKMTPARSNRNSGGGSPDSYSDSGRAPIGITSMRKLIPSEGGGGQQGDMNSLANFGIKRLDF
jgi:hypothetical protein